MKAERISFSFGGADLLALKAWAQSKKMRTGPASAELVAFALTELRSRKRGDATRPQLMGEQKAHHLTERIFAVLEKADDETPWLHVDYAKGSVATSKSNPGGRKGHVFLDIRPVNRAEWFDTLGNLTRESVHARLIGSARPVGVRT